ncbi:hypothetical protein [Amorphus sp. 3PC139-8]|uniref:hypothetical protein n=1 Tax=Amorphus sp. 3PC139-8 TaxID=2735676 RepID=UPI00345D5A75
MPPTLENEKPMPVVIIHEEMGVYLGNCLGLGFWTLMDCAGQSAAVTFPSEAAARDHVASWEPRRDPDECAYVELRGAGDYADRAAIEAAGLGHLLGKLGEEIDLERSDDSPEPPMMT